ncbi:glycoside hydrolase family protein [Clostridium perfringens]|uniref:glycoside hydrolase family protein n=1 Tax=Clostridium perfringens TaxID=1502 RepID=UPI0039EA0650
MIIDLIPKVNSGELIGDKPTFQTNATVKGDFLYVRSEDAEKIEGRFVNDGDRITVLDISYSRQLALVQYPTKDGYRQGYVSNATNIIIYDKQGEWLNGSTSEEVLDDSNGHLGVIFPYEKATPLYQVEGLVCIVYDTDKGKNTKSGYVMFKGINSSSESLNATSSYEISQNLIDFIADYEGFSATPYRGADYQNRTIGYGHVIRKGENIEYLSEDEAKNLLRNDLKDTVNLVSNLTKGLSLSENQFESLVSFAYNCGSGALERSTLLKDIKLGVNDEKIKDDFLAWSYCNGVKLKGLMNRRLDEWEIFAKGDYRRNY